MGAVSRVLLLLLAALLSAAGCGGHDDVTLDRWTLTVDGESTEVELPAHLDERLPRRASSYELRTTVDPARLPDDELRLVLPHFDGIAELFVDGQRATAEQYEPVEEYRHAGPHVWRLPKLRPDATELELVLAIEHRWTQSAWLSTAPRLHASGRLGAHAMALLLLNDFGAFATLYGLVLIGLMSLGVYLADRKRYSHLWFAIQLLSASYYPLYVSGYSQLLLGVYDSLVLAIMLDLALFASIKFTVHEFESRVSMPIKPWLVGLGLGILAAVASADPFWLTPVGGRATVVYLGLVLAYQIVVGLRLLRQPTPPQGARLFLLKWCLLAATTMFDGIAWMGLGDPLGGVRAGCLGLGIFSLLSALHLTLDYVQSLVVADDLNRQLERRVEALETKQREVEDLNVRLRDQMSHRSRQLFAMLSQLPSAGATPKLHLDEGDVVNERYRVINELGAGGMGVVYGVTRLADQMPLALKVTMQGDAWGLARLAREAEIAMLVDHPNVVAVVDVDIDPRRGFLYMVMEHVDGPSLAEYKAGFGRDRDWALNVLHQLASGLASLHEAGVVHRDLKPANVLLVMDGSGGLLVKLTDFGISRTLDVERGDPKVSPEDSDVQMPVVRSNSLDPATRRLLDAQVRGQAAEQSLHRHTQADREPTANSRLNRTPANSDDESTRELRVEEVKELELWEPSSPLTQAGCIVGTPVFMAPELARDPPLISAAADVFSFGVLAHQLLTGRRPFAEPPVMKVAEGRPLPPELDLDLREIPAGLRATMRACLSIDPEARPKTPRLAEVFKELIASRRARPTRRSTRPFPPVKVGDHEVIAHEPDAPDQREHETSPPPEPHAA